MGVSKANSQRLKLFWTIALTLCLKTVLTEGDFIETENGDVEIQDITDLESKFPEFIILLNRV